MKKLLPWLILIASSSLRAAIETRTIVVFPFENRSANGDLGWISEAFAEVLSTRLAGADRYVLGRDERDAAYVQLGIPAGTPVTLATAYKVAETLGVNWGVIGSFQVEGGRLTAQCRLLEMRRMKLHPPLEATGELTDLVSIQTHLAWRLLATYDPGFTTGTEGEFARRFPPIRLDAFENYVRGLLAGDDQSRVHFFTEADRLNPADHRPAFELGRYYFDEKEYATSKRWLAKLVSGDADYLESLFLRGVDAYFLGQDAEAEDSFAQVDRHIPLSEVANNLGVMEARHGAYAAAVAHFERAYQGDPSDPDYGFNLAACYWYLKKYQEAATSLRDHLKHDEDDPEAHALLAMVDGFLGDTEGERQESRWLAVHGGDGKGGTTPEFAPQWRVKKQYDGHAFRLLALTIRNQQEAGLARKSPEEHGQFHIDRGRRLLAEGKVQEAERELTEAASLVPENNEVHLLLGQTYEAEGRHREAAAELENSARLDNSAMTQLWLARVYLALNRPLAALEHGRMALTLDPGNRDARQLVQVVERQSGRHARAH